MTTHPPTQSTDAVQVTVHAGDGSTCAGSLISTDIVLLAGHGFLALPLRVEFADGLRHTVTGVHLAVETGAVREALCALTLPEGTAIVDEGWCSPLGLLPADLLPPDDPDATTSVWCRLFPRIPGC